MKADAAVARLDEVERGLSASARRSMSRWNISGMRRRPGTITQRAGILLNPAPTCAAGARRR